MILNSFNFLIVLPLVLFMYIIVLKLCQNSRYSSIISSALLTSISYGFFISYQPAGALFLFGITLLSYLFALWIERQDGSSKIHKKLIITISVLIVLLPLAIFKYSGFVLRTAEEIALYLGLGLHTASDTLDLIFIPLGISFFTFQSLSYVWDVYRGKFKAEHNFLYFMLFVGFFPQISSGPISKAEELPPQIKDKKPITDSDLTEGVRIMMWGYVLKTVIADRLALFVNPVFADYSNFSGVTCLIASIFFTLQIYGDFAGYSLIAIGIGRLFGFKLINNFRQPLLSKSITEFWRRWHISLSRWLKENVYIALGGNRKGRLHTYGNIMATFIVSGIWHGANMTFVLWGAINGFAQCIERLFGFNKDNGERFIGALKMLITFTIVVTAFVIFRMPTITDGLNILKRIVTLEPGVSLPMNNTEILFTSFAVLVLIFAEFFQEYAPTFSLLRNKNMLIRSVTLMALIFMILTMGVLDSSQFIYVKF